MNSWSARRGLELETNGSTVSAHLSEATLTTVQQSVGVQGSNAFDLRSQKHQGKQAQLARLSAAGLESATVDSDARVHRQMVSALGASFRGAGL